MKNPTRSQALIVSLLAAGVVACGDGAHGVDGAVNTEAGICGTHAAPGILSLANLSPAMGATVANQNIVHGFTVLGAPAEFNNFELRFGPSHTAGLPVPEKPKFAMTPAESDIVYQLTIDGWTHAPAHVELLASGGFETMQGCAWDFPSPLFSYDIVTGGDGGPVADGGNAPDSQYTALDGPPGVLIKLDARLKFDLGIDESSAVLDAGRSPDTEPGDGATPIDVALDTPLAAVDAAID